MRAGRRSKQRGHWVIPAAKAVGAFFAHNAAGQAIAGAAAGAVANKALAPSVPGIPTQPGVPQVDVAKSQLQQLDRLRQRRGALATMFGGQGANASAPATAGKTLLGQ